MTSLVQTVTNRNVPLGLYPTIAKNEQIHSLES